MSEAGTVRESEAGRTVQYGGFWLRVAATLIDSLLIVLLTTPLLYSIYGDQYFNPNQVAAGFWDVVISWLLPALAVIIFWYFKGASPGKMIFRLRIVDAETLGPAHMRQLVIRYLGYFVSSIPLGGGLLWVAYDRRKQGWHDKLAKTVVIRDR